MFRKMHLRSRSKKSFNIDAPALSVREALNASIHISPGDLDEH